MPPRRAAAVQADARRAEQRFYEEQLRADERMREAEQRSDAEEERDSVDEGSVEHEEREDASEGEEWAADGDSASDDNENDVDWDDDAEEDHGDESSDEQDEEDEDEQDRHLGGIREWKSKRRQAETHIMDELDVTRKELRRVVSNFKTSGVHTTGNALVKELWRRFVVPEELQALKTSDDVALLCERAIELAGRVDVPTAYIDQVFHPYEQVSGGRLTLLSHRIAELFAFAVLIEMWEAYIRGRREVVTERRRLLEAVFASIMGTDAAEAVANSVNPPGQPLDACDRAMLLNSATMTVNQLVDRINALSDKARVRCLLVNIGKWQLRKSLQPLEDAGRSVFDYTSLDAPPTRSEATLANQKGYLFLVVEVMDDRNGDVARAVREVYNVGIHDCRIPTRLCISNAWYTNAALLLRAKSVLVPESAKQIVAAVQTLLTTAPCMNNILSRFRSTGSTARDDALAVPAGWLLYSEFKEDSQARVHRLGSVRSMFLMLEHTGELGALEEMRHLIPPKVYEVGGRMRLVLIPPTLEIPDGCDEGARMRERSSLAKKLKQKNLLSTRFPNAIRAAAGLVLPEMTDRLPAWHEDSMQGKAYRQFQQLDKREQTTLRNKRSRTPKTLLDEERKLLANHDEHEEACKRRKEQTSSILAAIATAERVLS